MMELFKAVFLEYSRYGAAFAIGAVMAVGLHWPIIWLYKFQTKKLPDDFLVHLDLDQAKFVGILERILFCFAVMDAHLAVSGAYVLISGWLVLKAFNIWIQAWQKSEIRSAEALPMRRYHTYLYGNLLSIFGGVVSGLVAVVCYKLTCVFY